MDMLTLGSVADYINGRAFKPDEWEDSGKPIIRIQNLTNSTEVCNRTNAEYEDKYLIHDGDLLFAWSASLGAYIWRGEDGWLNQHIFKVIPRRNVSKLYLYYYLLHIIDRLYEKVHGSGMVHIPLKPFKETPIPVPALSEQILIVERIESLFTKLDEAREKAQAVVDGYEPRRAAILHRAFRGELTAQWRNAKGRGDGSWKTVAFRDVADVKSNLVSPFDYPDYPHIAPDNIEKKTGVLLNYRTVSEDGVKSEKHLFHAGQILYSRIRPNLSKVVKETLDNEWKVRESAEAVLTTIGLMKKAILARAFRGRLGPNQPAEAFPER